MRHLKKALVYAVALVLASTSFAYAEGSWSSYITGASTGFNSRTWTDRNADVTSTTIRFDGCVNNINKPVKADVTLQLTRETPWYQPDENRGRKVLYCSSSDTKSWGRQPSGNYHFTITHVSGSVKGNMSAKRVRVSY